MSKLVIIDAMAILHRAYHALPKFMSTSSGEPINAVYGLVSMLLRIIEDLKPTHIAVCFDRPEPTFRKIEFTNYQAQRPEVADELISQFDKAKDVLRAMDIPIFEKAGFEADDLIGTLAVKAVIPLNPKLEIRNPKQYLNSKSKILNEKNQSLITNHQLPITEVVIVTGDRDQFQLINDKVKLYMPITGLSKAKMYDDMEVVDKMGVKPSQIIDYKALVGDPSDNYMGVPGIGPKTALGLLNQFGSYPVIFKNLDKLKNKEKEKLLAGRESGDISYKLAKIDTNVSVDIDFEKMDKWDVGGEKADKLFEEYGFKTLRDRIKKFQNSKDSILQEKSKIQNPKYKKNLSKKEVEKVAIEIVKRLQGKQYAIRGTASMVLQGLDMGVDDIDIITDKKTALEINKIFKDKLLNRVEFSESDRFRSYFGSFVIDNVYCEVAGCFQVKLEKSAKVKEQSWSEMQDAREGQVVEIEIGDREKKQIKVTKLELELQTSADMGRWNEFHKIKKQIAAQSQQSLF